MGMRLSTPMSAPKVTARSRLQRASRAHAEILILGDSRHVEAAPNAPVAAHLDVDVIAQVDELKAGLQFVIAVGPPADDVQEQIELGGCRPGRAALIACPSQ